jgi:signal transduction histidine kinase
MRAFMVRAPFRDAALTLAGDGLVAGEWKISGVPAFDPADGRFRGYRGIALREPGAAAAPAEPAGDLLSDPDSLRELVHEIKTPLNAIIGFAEIIEGQYLGPADRRYRERAMDIVEQARLLVTAIDDLDFAAKVHSSGGGHHRVALGELVERIAPGLAELASGRGVELERPRRTAEATAAVEPQLADRLIFRMFSAMISEAQAGERMRLSVDQAGENCRVSITCPAALSGLSDEQLFGGGPKALQQGFSLRLVRGLARIAGADLTSQRGALSLLFPRA